MMTVTELKHAVERLEADDFEAFRAWFDSLEADRSSWNDDHLPPRYTPSDDVLRRAIKEALDDPRPSIPAEQVFDRLERRYQRDLPAITRKA